MLYYQVQVFIVQRCNKDLNSFLNRQNATLKAILNIGLNILEKQQVIHLTVVISLSSKINNQVSAICRELYTKGSKGKAREIDSYLKLQVIIKELTNKQKTKSKISNYKGIQNQGYIAIGKKDYTTITCQVCKETRYILYKCQYIYPNNAPKGFKVDRELVKEQKKKHLDKMPKIFNIVYSDY